MKTPANNPVGGTFDKIDAMIDAYQQLRISGLTITPSPEQLEVALDRMEGMVAEWFERNICCGYNFEDQPDPNSASGVERAYKQAIATNLAVRLIPDFNKEVPQTLMMQAVQSLSNLSGRSAFNIVNKVAYPSRMATGSGNTLRYNRWNRFYRTTGPQPASCKTNVMYVGDVNDFVEHFDAYLDGEVIASVVFSADSGITIQSSSFTDTDVLYQVLAANSTESTSTMVRQLTIIATTDTGRVQTRVVYFSIEPRPRAN